MAAVAAALAVTIAVAVASTRDSTGETGNEQAKTGTAAAASRLDGSQLTADRLYAVPAISEQPRLFDQPAAATTGASQGNLAGLTITIDAGHASNPDLGTEATGPGSGETKVKDPGGTSGAVTGQPEYAVNLSIAILLKEKLEASGAQVVMTRSGDGFDGGNIERAQIANTAGADLFIRIHCDGSSDQSTHGASTLYPALIEGWTDDIYAASLSAAQAVQAALVTTTGALDNGVQERADMTGFNWADVPAILVEAGYLTNPDEDRALASPDYQEAVAQGLYDGIHAFLGR